MYIILVKRNDTPIVNAVTNGMRIFSTNRDAEFFIADYLPGERDGYVIFELTERPAVN